MSLSEKEAAEKLDSIPVEVSDISLMDLLHVAAALDFTIQNYYPRHLKMPAEEMDGMRKTLAKMREVVDKYNEQLKDIQSQMK